MRRPLPTMLEKFCAFEKLHAAKCFLAEPVQNEYRRFSWQEAGSQVRRMAEALQEMGLGKDDKVAILSKNCAHWILADLAIAMAGCISVPLYPNITTDALREIIEHSESRAIFIGKLDNPAELRKAIPGGVAEISFPFYPNPGCLNWDQLIRDKEGLQGQPRIDPQAVTSILYTSGTTGLPKGVMHTSHAIAFAVDAFLVSYPDIREEVFFSYLPLCHVAERMLVECGAIFTGSTIYFVESLDTFARNLADTRPTLFLAVPRIWEKIQEGILQKMPQKKLDRLLALPLVGPFVKKVIRRKLGLGRARHLFTGASPISVVVLEWFGKLGIFIQEAYGMTENLALSHSNRRHAIRFGTVGQSYTGVEVRLGRDNEVQVKSEASMLGYYKEPELTAESFEDGFLRTGDEGAIDAAGYLTITGRIKDQFKTSKGKYIMPAPMEGKLLQNPELAQACIVGPGLPNAMALCTLSEQARKIAGEELKIILHRILTAVNHELEHHEQLCRLVILAEEWTIANGLLTPTLKIKRKMIEAAFGERYGEWIQLKEPVVFA